MARVRMPKGEKELAALAKAIGNSKYKLPKGDVSPRRAQIARESKQIEKLNTAAEAARQTAQAKERAAKAGGRRLSELVYGRVKSIRGKYGKEADVHLEAEGWPIVEAKATNPASPGT